MDEQTLLSLSTEGLDNKEQEVPRVIRYYRWVMDNKLKTVYYVSIVIGFILRLSSSLLAYGAKHPDETFQSLEMAHYIVFGTGFIPPEFQASNSTIESYAAARSWLFPYFFAFFMYVGKILGLDYFTQTLVLIKVYMAVHATLLIPAVYKFTNQLTKDEQTATFAAVGVAFSFRLIEFGVRTLTNTFFLPLMMYGLYKLFKGLEEDNLSTGDYFEIGFYLGVSTYIRFDMGILIFALFVSFFRIEHVKHYVWVGLSSFSIWLWGAWVDYRKYETAEFFSVPINWLTFNVIEGYSDYFGLHGPFSYAGLIFFNDLLFPWLFIVLFWPIVHFLRKPKRSILHTDQGKVFLKLSLTCLITWVIYSNMWFDISTDPFRISWAQSHKELRFIMSGLLIFIITSAVASKLVLASLPQVIDARPRLPVDNYKVSDYRLNLYRKRLLTVFFIFYLLINFYGGLALTVPDHHEGINRSLMYVGQEGNPDTIVIAEEWFNTGYFTYSHVNSSVEFEFVPVHEVDRQDFNQAKLRNIIADRLPFTYLIIPFYAFDHFQSLQNLLEIYGWSIDYTYELTSTWIYQV